MKIIKVTSDKLANNYSKAMCTAFLLDDTGKKNKRSYPFIIAFRNTFLAFFITSLSTYT